MNDNKHEIFFLYLFVKYCRWPLCFSTWQALKQRLSAGGGMEVGAMGLAVIKGVFGLTLQDLVVE